MREGGNGFGGEGCPLAHCQNHIKVQQSLNEGIALGWNAGVEGLGEAGDFDARFKVLKVCGCNTLVVIQDCEIDRHFEIEERN